MNEKQINAVEMTRKIRNEHAEHLAGKSHAERIAFFRERANKMESKLPDLFAELIAGSTGYRNPNIDAVLRRIRERQAVYKKK
jgi:hypothetical protein